jgi:hypothetical protein
MKIFNPIPNGTISNSPFSKTIEFSSYNSDYIISPAEGVIVSSDKFKCGGNIKIEHFIDGETYYSNFCNVNRIIPFKGTQVKPGEMIGTVGDSSIEYTVTDKSGSQLNAGKFLSGGFGETKTKENEHNKVTGVKPTEVDTYSGKKIPNPFMDALLSPFSIINKAFSEKSTISKKNDIKEDINKIKKLIKY